MKKFLALLFILSLGVAYADYNRSLRMNCILDNGRWGECPKETTTKPVPQSKRLALVPETNYTNYKKIIKQIDSNTSINKINHTSKYETTEKIITLKEKKEIPNRLVNLSSFERMKLDSYQSTYTIKDGDTIGAIARKFNIAQSEILAINPNIKSGKLKVGKEIFMPVDQDVVDSISREEYKIGHGDTLDKIAKKLKIKPNELKKYNKEKFENRLTTGDTIVLPLSSNIDKLKVASNNNKKESIIFEGSGKQLRVTASAYTSHVAQTSANPFLGAWGHRLVPGEKTIAVSRDLVEQYGLSNGKKVKIGGLEGEYTVRDKMNKRYEKHIDIYMGLDRAKALRWGRRSAMIFW